MNSKRGQYFFLFLGSVAIGLISRSERFDFPAYIDDNLGDVIWGGMVYFLISSLWVQASSSHRIVVACLFSFTIEYSQLLSASWLDSMRNIPGMRLVLGYGFKFSDLICYALGIAFAFFLDRYIQYLRAKFDSQT